MSKALIVYGGWDGHEPGPLAQVFERILKEAEFEVEVSDTLDAFTDERTCRNSTSSSRSGRWARSPASRSTRSSRPSQSGVGIAGCHGGMCDAFRDNTEWQFMTGGQWVAHPGNDGVNYTVNITERLRPDHAKASATSTSPASNTTCTSTRRSRCSPRPASPSPTARTPATARSTCPWSGPSCYGQGRVFYNSLGHHAAMLDQEPVRSLMQRGFLWAARQGV